MSDFEGGGGRIPKEYYRTDPGSREHGGGGLSGSAVEYVEIKLTFERTFRGKSPLVKLVYIAIMTHILQARVETHVLARVVTHVLVCYPMVQARVLLHVLAHVFLHVLAKCGSKWPCTRLPGIHFGDSLPPQNLTKLIL